MSKELKTMDAEALISKAIEKDVNIETMERLLAMRTQLKEEQAREAYFLALSQFQSQCPVIRKTKQVKGKDGSVRYSYAPLDDIVRQVSDPLKDNGLSFTISTEASESAITAICTIHHVGGHSESSPFSVPIDKDAYMNDAQKSGSALSYAKRYAFCNALGLLTSDMDDDGQSLGAGQTPQDLYRRFSQHTKAILSNVDSVNVIKDGIATNDLSTASEAWFELDDDTKAALWLAPTKGGCFTVEERKVIKSEEFRKAHYGSIDVTEDVPQ